MAFVEIDKELDILLEQIDVVDEELDKNNEIIEEIGDGTNKLNLKVQSMN